MEAENFTTNTAQGGKTWTAQTTSSPSGGAALIATPDTGAANNTGYTTTSPRLNFDVTFTQTGTYQVWVRGRAGGSVAADSDSVHVGLDGAAVASADRISTFTDRVRLVAQHARQRQRDPQRRDRGRPHRQRLDARGRLRHRQARAARDSRVHARPGPDRPRRRTRRRPAPTRRATGPRPAAPVPPTAAPVRPAATASRTGPRPASTAAAPAPPATRADPTAVWLEAEAGVRSGSPTFTRAERRPGVGRPEPAAPDGHAPPTRPARRASGTRSPWAPGPSRSGRGRSRPTPTTTRSGSRWTAATFVKWNACRRPAAWAWDDLHNSDNNNAVVTYTLAAGTHTLDVANREDGARLDKLYVTALGDTPSGLGGGTGPTCTDGMMNGTETGVDCGGSCPACATCSDGVRNGTETGVDCGGYVPGVPRRRPAPTGSGTGRRRASTAAGSCPACRDCTRRRPERDGDGRRLRRHVPGLPRRRPARTGSRTGRRRASTAAGSCPACTTGATTVWLEAEGGTRSGSPTFTRRDQHGRFWRLVPHTTSTDSPNAAVRTGSRSA